jgi:hypothetical protein
MRPGTGNGYWCLTPAVTGRSGATAAGPLPGGGPSSQTRCHRRRTPHLPGGRGHRARRGRSRARRRAPRRRPTRRCAAAAASRPETPPRHARPASSRSSSPGPPEAPAGRRPPGHAARSARTAPDQPHHRVQPRHPAGKIHYAVIITARAASASHDTPPCRCSITVTQHRCRVPLVGDEDAVEEFATDGADEALSDRVGPRCPYRCADDAYVVHGASPPQTTWRWSPKPELEAEDACGTRPLEVVSRSSSTHAHSSHHLGRQVSRPSRRSSEPNPVRRAKQPVERSRFTRGQPTTQYFSPAQPAHGRCARTLPNVLLSELMLE